MDRVGRYTRPVLLRGRHGCVGLIVAAVLVVLAVAAAIAMTRARDEHPVVLVDERAGVLRGVRFGDTTARIHARLGDPSDEEDGFFPAGTDFTGPPSIPSPRSDRGHLAPPEELHYDDTAYLVSRTAGVFAMASLADGARTRAGVGVGDELERVDEAYGRVSSGEAIAGEPLFGDDYPKYAWCRAKVGAVSVFFGGDPIESITLTRA